MHDQTTETRIDHVADMKLVVLDDSGCLGRLRKTEIWLFQTQQKPLQLAPNPKYPHERNR